MTDSAPGFLQRIQEDVQVDQKAQQDQLGAGMPPPAPRPRRPGVSSLHHTAMQNAAERRDDLEGQAATTGDGRAATNSMAQASDCSKSQAASATRHAGLQPAAWDEYFEEARDVELPERSGTWRLYTAGSGGPVVFCLHGGGYTALTWALWARKLKDRCRVAALDQRGHGHTTCGHGGDLSAEALTADAVAAWQAVYGAERPATVLVGHSMGGAVAVRAAASKGISSLEGLVVIDVVEGTALASLPHMLSVLRQRPARFPDTPAALQWALSSGMSRNAQAACVSLPDCLRPAPKDQGGLVWRTPLEESQPYWNGWYSGLSELLLGVTAPKVLMLAGTDRLDKPLTIGQMQGKFQLSLLPQAGHAVHEDEADKTAEVLSHFLQRFRVGLPKVPVPKAAPGTTRVLPVPVGPAFKSS